MRILQLTSKFPIPVVDGGSFATMALAKGLKSAGADLDLLSLNTDKHPASEPGINILEEEGCFGNVILYDIAIAPSRGGALKNLFMEKIPYFISRFYDSGFEKVLVQLLKDFEYDLVIIDHLNMTPYLRSVQSNSNLPTIIRTHNVENELRARTFQFENSGLKRTYLSKEVDRLKKYEIDTMNQADLVLTVSERDRSLFEKMGVAAPMKTIPIGTELRKLGKKESSSALKLGFIGSLDWQPNLDGIEWLIKSVWTRLCEENKNTFELHIAGSHSQDIQNSITGTQVTFHGRVDNSNAFIKEMDLILVPLWSGSGTRVKIIEAMSIGTPILSTTIGAEGLDLSNDAEIWISDEVDVWLNRIRAFQKDRDLGLSLVRKSQFFINRYHNETAIGQDLYDRLLEMIH